MGGELHNPFSENIYRVRLWDRAIVRLRHADGRDVGIHPCVFDVLVVMYRKRSDSGVIVWCIDHQGKLQATKQLYTCRREVCHEFRVLVDTQPEK